MTYQVEVGADGRSVILPEEIVRGLGLRPGTSMAAEVDGATVHLTATASDALTRLRAVMHGYSLDQFLSERRRDGSS